MACIFTHTWNTWFQQQANDYIPFSACLLCYATLPKCLSSFIVYTYINKYVYLYTHSQMGIILLPLNCIDVEIWIVCVCTQWILGRKLINITISKSWMKKKKQKTREKFTSPLWIGIVSKSPNHREFSRKGTGNAHSTQWERVCEGREWVRHKEQEFLISCRCLMIITGINFKRKRPKRCFTKGRISIHVVVDASTLYTNCSPGIHKDNTVTITSYSLAYLIRFSSFLFFSFFLHFFIYTMALKWFYRKILNQLSTWWGFFLVILYICQKREKKKTNLFR